MSNTESVVYWASINFLLNESYENYQEFVSGDVYACVKCRDVLEALTKLKKEIKNQELKPIAFEFIKPFVYVGWEREGVDEHNDGLVNEASDNDYAILDRMYCDERVIKEF